jgi:hypothetical protein
MTEIDDGFRVYTCEDHVGMLHQDRYSRVGVPSTPDYRTGEIDLTQTRRARLGRTTSKCA